jgi:hypothetical protein
MTLSCLSVAVRPILCAKAHAVDRPLCTLVIRQSCRSFLLFSILFSFSRILFYSFFFFTRNDNEMLPSCAAIPTSTQQYYEIKYGTMRVNTEP